MQKHVWISEQFPSIIYLHNKRPKERRDSVPVSYFVFFLFPPLFLLLFLFCIIFLLFISYISLDPLSFTFSPFYQKCVLHSLFLSPLPSLSPTHYFLSVLSYFQHFLIFLICIYSFILFFLSYSIIIIIYHYSIIFPFPGGHR